MKSTHIRNRCLFLPALLFICIQSVQAQESVFNSVAGKFDAYRKQALQEKLYVHLDRSFYYSGESIWFKVYDVDGTLHKPLDISAVAYVEIVDLTNHAVLQTKVELKDGAGNGALFLPSSLSSGNYLVRAYTRWMKNFDPEFYFQQPITILNALRKPEVVSTPEPAAIDIQFFPEGGNLVKGLKSKIGFRAVDKEGKGIDFSGAVMNASNDTLVKFHPTKFGIGHFNFTPSESQVYKVIVKDAKGKISSHTLPAVSEVGYTMSLTDSATIMIRVTTAAKLSEGTASVVYLLVHARNQIAVSVAGRLVQGKTIFPVDKKLLGNGINHLTLFNAEGKPVCERLYFKRPENNLIIAAKSDKQEYDRRRKVVMTFDAKSTSGTALSADLSVAIYRTDSLQTIQSTSIGQYLWLTSDLHGTIESPAYYLESTGAQADQVLDNLMLTHGWSRFKWNEVLNSPPAYSFLPEPRGFVMTGKVTNIISNTPAPEIKSYLAIPGKNIRLYTARSGQQGEVMFQLKDFLGTNKIVMQTDTQLDSIYKFELDDPFSQRFSDTKFPAFTIPASFRNKILSQSIHAQVQTAFYADSTRFLKTPIDTTAFYGEPYKKYFLDSYTRFTSMEDVMREYVAGLWVRKKDGKLHFWVLDELSNSMFRDNSLVLLDGVPVFQEEKILAFDPLKVEKLEIVARKYYLGPAIFNGIVSYTTATGDLANYPLDTRSLVQNYEGLQRQREFYSPRYDAIADRSSRLPDFRDLLFWTPHVKPDGNGKYSIEFYTSDQTGKYKVEVQGLTKDGLPGNSSTTFEVRNVSN